jgi:drug/metabolite transporter (DMT)-like permease
MPGVDESRDHPFRRGSLFAVSAAVLFGLTTPLIQRVGRGTGAVPTAACLYAGAALASLRLRGSSRREAPVRVQHLPRVLLIGLAGGLVAPACLAWGLQRIDAAGASLLLNFEAVFTVLLGWACFHEHVGRRVAAALGLMIFAGGFLLQNATSGGLGWGVVAVLAATLAWSVDNALTRPLADLDPTEVVRYKGLTGAVLGIGLSFALRQPFPDLASALALLAIGATGYGLSLRSYIRAQREIGAGRTASIFAVAPFLGAATAIGMGQQAGGPSLLAAFMLFAAGIYLHVTETHGHLHTHEPIEHEHAHRHDDGHHHHSHDPPVAGEHSHRHRHDRQTHDHPHAPDTHHQHRH